MNENKNETIILVGWTRMSKNGNSLVMNLSLEQLEAAKGNGKEIVFVLNTNKIVGLLTDEVEVVAASHFTSEVVPVPALLLNYNEKPVGDE
jgi:hypothetical protein